MNRLLCPIDFSEVSLNALEFAVAIAEKEQSEITLLNIFTRSDFNKILDSENVDEQYEELLEIAEAKLKAITEEILLEGRGKGLKDCTYELRSGKTVDIIVEMAEELHIDLIVMGTTGHSSYDRKYLGGKAQSIIANTHSSVLCIPENANFHGIDHIIYATDYQEEDKIAIQQLSQFGRVLNAHVEVLHVSHHNDTIDKAMFDEFKNELLGFVKPNGVSFDRVVFNHVADGLNDYMAQSEADLLVLLNKKQNFISTLFHRSLTQHLDKFTDYPLMVLKL